MPAAFYELRNRSLKSELIFMDALRGSRGDDKIPRRLEDPRGTEGLPESDIEFASWRPAPRQPRHDHSVSHPPIIRPNAGLSDRNRAPILPGPPHYAFFIESTGAYP
jgi:hypothetical protein